MQKKVILRGLIDKGLIEILLVLIKNPEKDFYLTELARQSNIPTATTYRSLEKLYKLEVIDIIKINKFKVYKLANNESTKFLAVIFEEKQDPIQNFTEEIKKINEVEQLIMHGEQKDNATNILLIGNKIDSAKIDAIVERIKTQTNHEISFVSLDEAQYQKMTRMGLYSGKKKILFSK